MERADLYAIITPSYSDLNSTTYMVKKGDVITANYPNMIYLVSISNDYYAKFSISTLYQVLEPVRSEDNKIIGK